jgi:hypothetical protein
LDKQTAAQQINARELLIFVFLKVTWATIVLAIEGIFAYPHSRDFKRYSNEACDIISSIIQGSVGDT